jgi:hypothetical protein
MLEHHVAGNPAAVHRRDRSNVVSLDKARGRFRNLEALAWAESQRIKDASLRLLLMAIAGFADVEGRCWPSQAALASIMQQCDRTVRRKVKKLEELGLIEVSARRKAHGERDSSLIVLKGFATGQQGVRLSTGHNRPSPPDNKVSGITTNQEEPRESAREARWSIEGSREGHGQPLATIFGRQSVGNQGRLVS